MRDNEIRNRFALNEVIPPPVGAVTYGEFHCQLVHMNPDEDATQSSLERYRREGGLLYPTIHVESTHTAKPALESILLNNNDQANHPSFSFLRKRKSSAQGGSGGTSEGEPNVDGAAAASRQDWWAFVSKFVRGLSGMILPNRGVAENQWPIRAFGWNRHLPKFACVTSDDYIKLYDLGVGTFKNREQGSTPQIGDWVGVELQHQFQVDVNCLEWKPHSGRVLAVGCSNGICLWTLPAKPSGAPKGQVSTSQQKMATWEKPKSATMSYLRYPGHAPVQSLAWSPDGRLLASASSNDSAIIIWDVATEVGTAIRRFGGGISLLKWSPSGRHLFAASCSSTFRVWETANWTCQKWNALAAPCHTACWSRDGEILLFALKGESLIRSIRFPSQGPKTAPHYIQTDDISEYTVKLDDDKEISAGGNVREITWDPHKERLAVSLEGSDLVGVFATNISPTLQLSPRGFLRGPPGSGEVTSLSFYESFDKGALLGMCWSESIVTLVPFYYQPEETFLQNPVKVLQNW